MHLLRATTGPLGSGALALGLLAMSGAAQETTRVSVDSAGAQANRESFSPSISADGRFVAFGSRASNLVPGDTNGFSDIFVRDASTGLVERVSVDSVGAQAIGNSYRPSISADGRFVAFWSEARLVPDDTGWGDAYVHDRSTGVTERVSIDSSGAQGNDESDYPVISADGGAVAFASWATNLVPQDNNGMADIFVRDRSTGLTTRVSVRSSGREANDFSDWPSISADGRIVVFSSPASNLVPGDTAAQLDVFAHDRSTGQTARVSVDSSGAEANGGSFAPASISADGRFVPFMSTASNLVANDTNSCADIFVHDRSTGLTELVSVDSSGSGADDRSDFDPTISADARIVGFRSWATNLVANDANGRADLFVHDRLNGLTERVNVDTTGTEANGDGYTTAICADGQIVAFSSLATNLVANDTNSYEDVFVRRRCAATWSNYGAGFAGTNGVPGFTARTDPVLGSTLTLDLANSYGLTTAGVLFIGFQRTTIPTSWGGELLVLPVITQLVPIAPAGNVFSGAIPDDGALCGVAIDLQAIESDPGASRGVSFTAGLELELGR